MIARGGFFGGEFDRLISCRISPFVVMIPVLRIAGQHPLLYVAPAASLVMCFLFAIWVERRLESRFVVHGLLVGAVSTLLYVGLTRAQPEPFAYYIAHGLKLLGGVAGGFLAGRQSIATAGEYRSAPK